MSDWFQAILALCAIAVTATVVPLLVRLKRTAERAEALLAAVERELPPLMAELHGLADALRDTIREVQQELKRAGAIADHVDEVAGGVARVVHALSGFSKAGQALALAAAVRKGVEIFVARLRGGQSARVSPPGHGVRSTT
jgi:ABC-type transporter Mla subunit MlaD